MSGQNPFLLAGGTAISNQVARGMSALRSSTLDASKRKSTLKLAQLRRNKVNEAREPSTIQNRDSRLSSLGNLPTQGSSLSGASSRFAFTFSSLLNEIGDEEVKEILMALQPAIIEV